ncbi:MAG: reverse transcriptase domain-containing protein, partial [Candidatus Thorarchaeota archaeon]
MKAWKELYSEEKLLKAALKLYEKSLFYCSKSYNTWIDEETLYDFATDSSKRLNQLHRALANQTFEFSNIQVKRVRFWQKERFLHVECWEDKIVNSMLFNMLNVMFDNRQSPYSYAYKHKSGGVDACQRAIIKFIQRNNCKYFIKRDIKSYFPTIDHDLLLKKLDIKDDYLRKIVTQRIKFNYIPHDVEDLKERGIWKNGCYMESEIGVPFGTPIACFFANWFLNDLDKKFEKLDIGYFRYADDFLLASPSREAAVEGMKILDESLRELKLKSKASAAHQYSFETSDQPVTDDVVFEKVHGFKHLGLFYRADQKIGLSRDKLLKVRNLFLRKFKRCKKKIAKMETVEERVKFLILLSNEALQYIKPTAVIDYYLKHVTDESQLVDLDRWLAEEILARATGKGHKKGNFRHFSFKRMRELGLPSLVHRKRLINHGHINSDFFKLRNSKLTERYQKRKKAKALRGPRPKQAS